MKHPHADIIKAWADGIPVQMWDGESWIDLDPPGRCAAPAFWVDQKYRIKPPIKKYRVALMKHPAYVKPWTSVVDTSEQATRLLGHRYFYKWLTDWVEYEDPTT
jgi:hypothetical protein